jgi:hypothetical protein
MSGTGVHYGLHPPSVNDIRRAQEAQQLASETLRRLQREKRMDTAAKKARRASEQNTQKIVRMAEKAMKEKSAEIKDKANIEKLRSNRNAAHANHDVAAHLVHTLKEAIEEKEEEFQDADDGSDEKIRISNELATLRKQHTKAQQAQLAKFTSWGDKKRAVVLARQLYKLKYPFQDDEELGWSGSE